MRARKLNQTVLMSLLVSMLSVPAVSAAGRANNSRVRRPNATAPESRRVVPFRSDKTNSWMCQNASAFWCNDGRATEPSPSVPARRGRGRG